MKRWTVIVETPAKQDIEAAFLGITERNSAAARFVEATRPG
jgi:hypothetical protein